LRTENPFQKTPSETGKEEGKEGWIDKADHITTDAVFKTFSKDLNPPLEEPPNIYSLEKH